MVAIKVNVGNFARAETDRMLAAVLKDSGGVNQWMHNRVPTPLDHQPVIRMNRDTLYSGNIVDITHGATMTVPDAGGRYVRRWSSTEITTSTPSSTIKPRRADRGRVQH